MKQSFSLSLSEATKCVMFNALPPIKSRSDPKLKFKVGIVMGYIKNELNKCRQIAGQKKNKKKRIKYHLSLLTLL